MEINELKTIVKEYIAKGYIEKSHWKQLLIGIDLTINNMLFESIVFERMNSEVQCVFKVDGRLYEIYGNYDSWGTSFDDLTGFYEVTPVNETITVYKPI